MSQVKSGTIPIVEQKKEPEKPKAPVVQPPANNQTKEVRRVVFTKNGSNKWESSFEGPVSRRDINRLRVTMLVMFLRMKRQARLKSRTEQRAAQTKEESNGTE